MAARGSQTRLSGIGAVVILGVVFTTCVAEADLTLPYYGTTSTSGKAFWVSNSYTGAGATYGGFFYSGGEEGRGVFGQSAGSSGMGVKGWASNDGDVQNYGGHFCATGAMGIGVYGWADNTGDVENYGGMFLAEGAKGIGIQARGGPEGLAGQFDGDVLITGHDSGIIFPDGTKQTTAATTASSGGGSAACAAKPAYDSGWVATPTGSPSQTLSKQLTHNLGGNVDDYIVDLQMKRTTIVGPQPPTNQGIGSTFYYAGLTTTGISVWGPGSAIDAGTYLRVRIWLSDCDGGGSPEPK
jgi:hypothetical protein